MNKTALIGGAYRYRLERIWRTDRPPAVFIMLNPSTATALVDDPTIRRCINFAAQIPGSGGLVVVNLYALRATQPADLWADPAPIGPDNDGHIVAAVEHPTSAVVCAWGAHGERYGRGRQVFKLIRDHAPPQCLGFTRRGEPGTPFTCPAT